MGGEVLGPGTAQGISSSAFSVATLKRLWLPSPSPSPLLLLTQCCNVAQPTKFFFFFLREKEPPTNMTFSAMTNLGMRLASCFA